MDREKMIDGWGRELARVRSQMDELGPIAVGTLSRSTKKYRTKDGAEHTCSDSAVLKFAGAGKNLTVRVPGDKEKTKMHGTCALSRPFDILPAVLPRVGEDDV